MWQHTINFLLGLVLVIIALISALIGTINSDFAWTLGVTGLAVAILGMWGFFDEASRQPHFDHGIETRF